MVYRKKRVWSRRFYGSPRYNLSRKSDWFHKTVQEDISNAGRELGDKIGNEIKSVKIGGVNISGEDLNKIVKKILSSLTNETLGRIAEYSGRVFRDIRDELFQRYGFVISEDTLNRELVKDLVYRVINIASKGIKDASEKDLESLADEIENPTTPEKAKEIVDKLVDTAKDEYSEVSRTALSSLYMEANRRSYQIIEADLGLEPDKAKYRWYNAMDYRTTDTCKRITERTKNGVSMEELTRIVKEESEREFPGFWKEDNPLFPHYQCRSTFYLVVE
jgi:hypothetical protein